MYIAVSHLFVYPNNLLFEKSSVTNHEIVQFWIALHIIREVWWSLDVCTYRTSTLELLFKLEVNFIESINSSKLPLQQGVDRLRLSWLISTSGEDSPLLIFLPLVILLSSNRPKHLFVLPLISNLRLAMILFFVHMTFINRSFRGADCLGFVIWCVVGVLNLDIL